MGVAVMKMTVGASVFVAVGSRVSVGPGLVAVADTCVAVGGMFVAVGGTFVAVGGTLVLVTTGVRGITLGTYRISPAIRLVPDMQLLMRSISCETP